MRYVGLRDLIRRWVYTPQGARKVIRARDFPAPQIIVDAGKTKVWLLPDVELFERSHPELTSEEAKRRKRAGYAAALAKKRKEA